ncbi:MAG: AMP-binding protein [Actinomycetota bacterium]|nr:AMP-binding protein [Actinomycetota bacterium]
MSDNLSQLLSTPLQPLRAAWRSSSQADLLGAARKLDEQSPDTYWTWVAEQQRWTQPWTTVRTGELGDFSYFDGATMNVADNCVDRWAEDPATADKAAVIWEGEPGDVRSVTYTELADEVLRLSGALAWLGVTRGDVVAIYMPNCVEAFTAIHACNRIGAIYTVLFSGFGADAVTARLQASRAKLVVVLDAAYRRGKLTPLLETLRTARGKLDSVAHTVVVDRTGRNLPLGADETSYAEALNLAPEGVPVAELEANDPAFLIFTSGTEAKPKGVVHSVAGFLLGTWANVLWQVAPQPDDVYWVAADVGWLTFPIQAVVGGLANGMTIVCFEGAMDTPSNARFYEICEKHGVTKVLGAPTLLRMLRKYGDELAAAHPLADLQLVTVQGEPLDGDTFGWATEHLGGGVPVVNAYGQTETGSTWAYPVAGAEALKPGSTGTAVPGHAYQVVDDEGKPVSPGTKGNLVLTQPFPTLARNVWEDPERYHNAYFSRFPGCYCTNDEAVVDGDGHLWVLGRADDVINVAAHRISTLEIEAIATAHRQVAEAAVVGVSDPTKGTVPIAFLTLLDGADPGQVKQEVADAVSSQLGGYARLSQVYLTSALPKTRTGKTMRRLLRDVVEHGAPQGDITAMDDAAGLHAVQQAVGAAPNTEV